MMFYRSKKVHSKSAELLTIKYNQQIDVILLFVETPFIASESESEEDDVEQIVKANLIAKSLLTPAPDQKLGAWEAHTKVSSTALIPIFLFLIEICWGVLGFWFSYSAKTGLHHWDWFRSKWRGHYSADKCAGVAARTKLGSLHGIARASQWR